VAVVAVQNLWKRESLLTIGRTMSDLEVGVDPDGTLRLSGEFDMSSVETFRMAVETSVDPDRELVFDLTDLTFIDSSGIRAILTVSQEIRANGVVLRHPQPNVRRVIELIGIEGRSGIRVEG
jgi:anti-anti-sigma factor